MANKLYKSEEIEFENGHTTLARPLTIKKLKVFQQIFEEYGNDLRRMTEILEGLQDSIHKAKQSNEPTEEIYASAKDKAKDYKTYNDTLCEASLVALRAWGVKDERGQAVEDIDIEYVEETLDILTAQRICEVAGNFSLGDLSDEEVVTGKAGAQRIQN